MHFKICFIFVTLGILMLLGVKAEVTPSLGELLGINAAPVSCEDVKCFGQNSCRTVAPPCIPGKTCPTQPLCSTQI
ncbi:uncharacterized protein CELE_C25E10.13 [Caenorhabditis elegans]|uniref:Secreted protein n=1 Tax=Caenorhabditis elegans TaxID=6239 RepID=Q6ACW9_CAEEL|nr:Secreted protein [Caenorhabditis elegans]CCD65659.1 Secreted protein [Caenorhabditis elegans]|eukprot:NP_001023677.1 Uncharacterized protein CELE_C25E10.13 [Caenorhabditis elegans]